MFSISHAPSLDLLWRRAQQMPLCRNATCGFSWIPLFYLFLSG